MADEPKKKMHPLGCLAILAVGIAIIVGLGMLFAKRKHESMTPCERYAETVAEALDNCHSGVNRNHKHHIAICEDMVDASDDCLEKITKLSCDQLERGPAISVGTACLK